MKQNWQERLSNRDESLHIHLIGIGGAGLSAIATVLLEMGVRVSGSDRQANTHTDRLAAAGATIYTEQVAANLTASAPVQRPDVVLISSAIAADNAERQAADALGLPVVKRNAFFPALLAARRVIAVAGSHGKSTTTSMIVKLLREGGLDVGYIIGTELPGYGNASAGSHPLFVIEADEYDHMFLGLRPALAVITNVEWDHPDCFPTPQDFQAAFEQFVQRIEADGLVISCADDDGAETVRATTQARAETPRWIGYGLNETAQMWAHTPQPVADDGSTTSVYWQGTPLGELRLSVLGLHNVRNALAALCVGHQLKIPMAQMARSLYAFRGTARRLEWKGEANGITVFDDYAHHPTEVQATLAALRQRYPQRRIWVVFQPHTFSRTRQMVQPMSRSFADADHVLVTDIFAARERDDGRVSAADIVAQSPHPAITHVPTLDAATAHLLAYVRPGDVVITLGAGDGYKVGEALLTQLQNSGVKICT